MPTKNNNLNMKKREKEEIIDGLLVFANDYLERSGYRLNQVHFDFSQNGNDTNTFIKKTDLSYIQIEMALKACISRGFLKYHYGDGGFQALRLTEEGQGRAISIDNAVDRKQILEGNVSIGTLNASGPTQIGNYNTQNIENIFNSIHCCPVIYQD